LIASRIIVQTTAGAAVTETTTTTTRQLTHDEKHALKEAREHPEKAEKEAIEKLKDALEKENWHWDCQCGNACEIHRLRILGSQRCRFEATVPPLKRGRCGASFCIVGKAIRSTFSNTSPIAACHADFLRNTGP
jgi:hypothetical protein